MSAADGHSLAVRPVAEWEAAIAAASASGDHLLAIDLATRGLREHPASLLLEYRRLLGFARAGAARRAEVRLAALEREGRLDGIADARLRVDFAALKGRLLKDRAIGAQAPEERARLAGQAAEAYEAAFGHSASCFPAVNAATLWQVAGEPGRAAAMAHAAITHAETETDPYWRLATQAEAHILLSEEVTAAEALRQAAAAGAGRLDAIASTRRQLNWLARVTGLGRAALAAMPTPCVLHWLAEPNSHPPGGAVDLPDGITGAGAALLAFGSVLSAADIAIGEALLDRGAGLGLVLPCAPKFCRVVLAERHGAAMAERFDRLLSSARSVSAVTPEGDPGEATVLTAAVIQSRGHAVLRAASLVTRVEVLSWSDGRASLREVTPGAEELDGLVAAWPDLSGGNPVWSGRRVRAIVFGDVQGFSTIDESQHAAFLETVVGGFADALAPLGARVDYAETAGDGIYLVLTDVLAAMRACYALHRSVDPGRLRAAGLPGGLALRLSAHVGPVFQGMDRVTGREKFFGKEVVRTARIEPVTPPGETYVTEQFAAVLACLTGAPYDCEYVGIQPMAKGFGECRMYSLRAAERLLVP
jgi:hypothetical protein